MNNFINVANLVANDQEVPAWVVNSFPTIKIVLAVLICLCAIFIIVSVLCQKTEAGGGSNAITGQADTFYNRNKGESLQGKVKKMTVIVSIIILVLCVAFLVINTIYKGY